MTQKQPHIRRKQLLLSKRKRWVDMVRFSIPRIDSVGVCLRQYFGVSGKFEKVKFYNTDTYGHHEDSWCPYVLFNQEYPQFSKPSSGGVKAVTKVGREAGDARFNLK